MAAKENGKHPFQARILDFNKQWGTSEIIFQNAGEKGQFKGPFAGSYGAFNYDLGKVVFFSAIFKVKNI